MSNNICVYDDSLFTYEDREVQATENKKFKTIEC